MEKVKLTYPIITSFYEVKLEQNYLVVIDIDETIIMYEGMCSKWWNAKMKHYLEEFNGDFDKADIATTIEWKTYILNKIPEHTDANGFFDLIGRTNQLNLELFIVTARDLEIEQLTYEHLRHLNIPNINVHFTAGSNKAHMIESVMSKKIENYDKIIFIDDNDVNLDDVSNYFGDKVICYKFKHAYDE